MVVGFYTWLCVVIINIGTGFVNKSAMETMGKFLLSSLMTCTKNGIGRRLIDVVGEPCASSRYASVSRQTRTSREVELCQGKKLLGGILMYIQMPKTQSYLIPLLEIT